MTDTNFKLSPDTIKNLFDNGKCLTFRPFISSQAWAYAMDEKHRFEKQTGKKAVMKSKTALMPQENFTKSFHFFSNGILILATTSEKKINNIKRVIKLQGFEIEKIYGPEKPMDEMYFDMFLHDITKEAEKRYPYQEDLLIEPLPDVKTFVENLFKDNNECLSASKNEILSPKYRDYMAFFANGRIIVSEEKANSNNIFGTSDYMDLKSYDSDYVLLDYEYVPHFYLEAIYQKAKEYDWYISKENMQKLMPQQNISDEDINKMNAYIDSLLKNRKCISVTIPYMGGSLALSPDKEKYVLFDDGTLVYAKQTAPTRFLKKCFPDLEIKEDKVPEYYIAQIYKRLLSVQKSANTIFEEMLKQKAKKLKKMIDVPHYQALEIVSKMAGLSCWEQVSKLTEQESRRGVYIEQKRKKIYSNKTAEELIEQEYHNFLKNNK